MLRVSFKSWCVHSGLIKIAHPTACTIPEISRYYPAAACTIQNSKEACFSRAHPSVSPSPFNRCIISAPSMEQAGDLPHHDSRICALLTVKKCPHSFGILHYSRVFYLDVGKQHCFAVLHKNAFYLASAPCCCQCMKKRALLYVAAQTSMNY